MYGNYHAYLVVGMDSGFILPPGPLDTDMDRQNS